MALRIGSKVSIVSKLQSNEEQNRIGKVLDLKWNLVLIQFENGECDWVESRTVYSKSNE